MCLDLFSSVLCLCLPHIMGLDGRKGCGLVALPKVFLSASSAMKG